MSYASEGPDSASITVYRVKGSGLIGIEVEGDVNLEPEDRERQRITPAISLQLAPADALALAEEILTEVRIGISRPSLSKPPGAA